jgi:hypothetical protein
MIVVTLDMWPQGDKSRKYRLGRTYIYNRGEHTSEKLGNYNVIVAKKGREDEELYGASRNVCRRGEVTNYPRLSYNVWRLITRALKSAFPEEA